MRAQAAGNVSLHFSFSSQLNMLFLNVIKIRCLNRRNNIKIKGAAREVHVRKAALMLVFLNPQNVAGLSPREGIGARDWRANYLYDGWIRGSRRRRIRKEVA